MGPATFDCNKRLILLSVIQLSNGHCNKDYLISETTFLITSNLPFEVPRIQAPFWGRLKFSEESCKQTTFFNE